MFARLLRILFKPFIRPAPPSVPQYVNARSSAQPVRNSERMRISITLSPDDLHWSPIGSVLDGQTILARPASQHYRDEDGELRPTRFDRSPLSDSSLKDLAAEFLRAQTDAENAPDPFEREIIAVLRDAYGREIWRRVSQQEVGIVHAGGRRFTIVQFTPGGFRMVPLDEA